MKTRTMRVIDWYLGVPLCYLLAAYELLRKLLPQKKKKVKNLLFIKFFGIGSIILSSPAIQAAREQFEDAEIHYLTFASNREILAMLGNVDHIHTIHTSTLWSFFTSTMHAIISLRRAHIDIVFDLEFFAKFPLVISTLIGAQRKAGFYLTYESWRRSLLDDLGYYNHYWHVKDIFLSLVYLVKKEDRYYLNFDEWTSRYVLPKVKMDDEVVSKTKSLLALNKWDSEQRLVLLNPNAGKELAPELKRWVDERWATLAEELTRSHPDIFIVYTGTGEERSYVESITARIPENVRQHIYNSAGQLSLKELLAVFSISNLLITTDSGPMHLASLTKIPIIGLFFAETPVLYAPLSKKAHIVCPSSYAIPSFTVYTGKDPVLPPTDTLAKTVQVEEVLGAAIKLISEEGRN